jgi:methionyl-tRNA formyltransferase
VVAAYGQILNNDVLSTAPHGGINVHASLLPKYRGAAPIAWAILNGEKVTGVTIIRMTTGLDAGAMLAQASVAIGPEETSGELEARLAPLGATLALKVIDQIEAGTAQPVPQDKSLVTKAPKLTKEMGLIDWTQPGERICNHVRAMQPWPTAYTFWRRGGHDPLRVIITRARWRTAPSQRESVPGTILILPEEHDRLWVAAGEQTQVEVVELQPAGKKKMTGGEFVRGRRPQPGDRFGPEEP